MADYKVVKFTTGQEVVADIISYNDDTTITMKNVVHILPDQSDPSGKSMLLSPFVQFADVNEAHTFNEKDIMLITNPVPAIIDMMTQKFSSIIQPSAEASNVAKLIL